MLYLLKKRTCLRCQCINTFVIQLFTVYTKHKQLCISSLTVPNVKKNHDLKTKVQSNLFTVTPFTFSSLHRSLFKVVISRNSFFICQFCLHNYNVKIMAKFMDNRLKDDRKRLRDATHPELENALFIC